MKKILLGAIFVFFSVNVPLGEGTLGLLPDFVGYFFLLQGAKELKEREDVVFHPIRLAEMVWKVLLVVSLLLYGLELFNISLPVDSVEGIVCSVLLAAGECYCWKKFTDALGRMEREHVWDLNTLKVTTAWWIYVIAAVLNVVVIFVRNPLIFGIILGLTITAPVYFIVQLYGMYKRYQSVEKK